MFLTVVVSCFNQEKYIEQCLISVYEQDTNFDFEVIIADDCSTDSTRLIIEKINIKYNKFTKLLFQKNNVGAGRNYIDAHNLATGKYVAHFDGDDVMLPGKLQSQVDVMEKNSNCNIVFHKARYFNDDRSYVTETGNLLCNKDFVRFSKEDLARWGTIAVHSSYMYRRSTRRTIKHTFEFMEWFFAFESLGECGEGIYINEVLVEYRCNQTGNAYLSSKTGREKTYNIIIQNVISEFHKKYSLKSDLYAHQIVNILMYIKNIRNVKRDHLKFLFFNIMYLRPLKLINTVKVRGMTGPKVKNR